MTQEQKMTPEQKRILFLSILAYTVLYVMRLNISLALPSLGEGLSFEFSTLGGITSAFFWCYAIGQLINGWLGDRISVKWMVFTGLFFSGLFNILISISSSYLLILLFWGLNGFVQSMLWSPIVKCVAEHFSGKKLVTASFALSFAQVIGYMVAWSLSYLLNQFFGWQSAFCVPGVLGLMMALVWVLLFRSDVPSGKSTSSVSVKGFFRQKHLLVFLGAVAVFSILHGLVKNSLDVWLPTMISDLSGLSSGGTIMTLILIPIINFAGLAFSRFIVGKKNGNVYSSILVIWLAATGLCAVVLALFGLQPVIAVFLTVVLFSAIYATSPLFTSFIPLDLQEYGYVSTVTGFVDFAIYMGASLTGVASTVILGDGADRNWSGLILYWLAVLAAGIAVAIGVAACRKWLRRKTQKSETQSSSLPNL